MGEWRYDSTIFNLSTRWRWIISFMALPIYSQRNHWWYPLHRNLGDPEPFWPLWGRKKSVALARNQTPNSSVNQPIAWSLYQLSYHYKLSEFMFIHDVKHARCLNIPGDPSNSYHHAVCHFSTDNFSLFLKKTCGNCPLKQTLPSSVRWQPQCGSICNRTRDGCMRNRPKTWSRICARWILGTNFSHGGDTAHWLSRCWTGLTGSSGWPKRWRDRRNSAHAQTPELSENPSVPSAARQLLLQASQWQVPGLQNCSGWSLSVYTVQL
jgi:hypothetical protein